MSTFEMRWLQTAGLSGTTTHTLHVHRGFGPSWQANVTHIAELDMWDARYWIDNEQRWRVMGRFPTLDEAKQVCENCARLNIGNQPGRSS